ncbi:MAG: hydrogenase maturation protease [Eggerthellaceae bacterium]|nr:hydrogenase maturation protease [Eggerthellaceae bacterium]
MADVKVVMTAGSVLRGDDAAGPYLAKLMQDDPIEGWEVIDGAQTPEDDLAVVRRMHPELLVLVDAAAMDEEPGCVARLGREDVVSDYLMTTHSLPMTFLLDNLKQYCGSVIFLGIQAAQTELLEPLSPPVLKAVENIYAWVKRGAKEEEIACLSGSSSGRVSEPAKD